MSRLHTWLVRHVTYPLWQMRSGGTVLQYLDTLERTQWLDAGAIRDLQWARLQPLLAHAQATGPFYRDRWAAAGVTAADVRSLDDLRLLPPLEKEELRDSIGRLGTGHGHSSLIHRKTSGSTGIPISILATPQATDQWVAAVMRARRWWGIELGDRRITLESRQPMTRKRWLKQFWYANVLELSAMDLSEVALRWVCRHLERGGVRALSGYPSTLSYVARFVEETTRGGPWGLKAVLTTGEILHPDIRAQLTRVFQCPVADEYGTSETGHIAGECLEGRLHIAAENVVVEVDAAAPDGHGALLLTDLTNYATPIIRYRIGDLGTLGTPCTCGRGLPVLELSVGRLEDLVVLADGRRMDSGVFDVVIDELALQGIPFRQFRVVQHALDHFEVLVDTSNSLTDVSVGLSRRIVEALGAPVTVEVKPVADIPPERTGKRRRFISRIEERVAGTPSAR